MFCPKSSPSLTYIGGPKGEALHLSIESFILGSLLSFNIFFGDGPIKLAHYHTQKKIGLVRHPQLIYMKQKNKYPRFIMGVSTHYGPQFVPLCNQPRPKLVTNNFGNKSFMQKPMRRLNMHSSKVLFFSFWGRWVREVFFFFFHVPNVFPLCSHHVSWSSSSSQVVPQNFPNGASVLSHMVCPKFNPHVCKLKRWSIESTFVSICNSRSKEVLLWGSVQCSQYIGDGPMNVASQYFFKKIAAHP